MSEAQKVTFQTYFENEECIKCGVPFAIPHYFKENKMRTHELFYCPNGHGQYYSGKNAEEKLKDEITSLQERLNNTLTRENELRVINDKLQKRIGAGVCPCCKRTFKQLANHMKHKHPDYIKKKT